MQVGSGYLNPKGFKMGLKSEFAPEEKPLGIFSLCLVPLSSSYWAFVSVSRSLALSSLSRENEWLEESSSSNWWKIPRLWHLLRLQRTHCSYHFSLSLSFSLCNFYSTFTTLICFISATLVLSVIIVLKFAGNLLWRASPRIRTLRPRSFASNVMRIGYFYVIRISFVMAIGASFYCF